LRPAEENYVEKEERTISVIFLLYAEIRQFRLDSHRLEIFFRRNDLFQFRIIPFIFTYTYTALQFSANLSQADDARSVSEINSNQFSTNGFLSTILTENVQIFVPLRATFKKQNDPQFFGSLQYSQILTSNCIRLIRDVFFSFEHTISIA
jgi:hypothetical protein